MIKRETVRRGVLEAGVISAEMKTGPLSGSLAGKRAIF